MEGEIPIVLKLYLTMQQCMHVCIFHTIYYIYVCIKYTQFQQLYKSKQPI